MVFGVKRARSMNARPDTNPRPGTSKTVTTSRLTGHMKAYSGLLFFLKIGWRDFGVCKDLVCRHVPIVYAGFPARRLLVELKIVMPGQSNSVVGLEIAEAFLNRIVDFLLMRARCVSVVGAN